MRSLLFAVVGATCVVAASVAPAQQTIHYGDNVQGAIDSAGQIDSYDFGGSSGDIIFMRMVYAVNGSPRLELYAPDGTPIADVVGAGQVELDTFCLPVSGSYTLLVTDELGLASGAYGLYLQRTFSPGQARSIAYGANVQDSVVITGEVRAYEFDGVQGDIVNVRMIYANNGSPRLDLYDPGGSLIRRAVGAGQVRLDTVHLPSSGRYALLAMDQLGIPNGTYTLTLVRVGGGIVGGSHNEVLPSHGLRVTPDPLSTVADAAFETRAEGNVRLDLFDLVGRPVSCVFNGWMPPGHHEIRLVPGNLPDGVYVCRLCSVGFAAQRLITLKHE